MNQAESYLNHEWNSYVRVTSRLLFFRECMWLRAIVHNEGLDEKKKTALKWKRLEVITNKANNYLMSHCCPVFSLYRWPFSGQVIPYPFFMWKCKKSNKESHFKSDEYFEHDRQILPKDKIFFLPCRLL